MASNNLIDPIRKAAGGGIIAQIDDDDEVDTGIEFDDEGGAIAKIASEETEEDSEVVAEFYDNIVETFDDNRLSTLSTTLLEQVERDKKSREERDKQYAEATKRTGLGKEAPGGAQFEGASRVVHPMLLEACLDFASRAIRELMPPNGPVKMFVPGNNVEPERLRKAERKKNYMNWQCIFQMPELRSEMEQLLSQLPLGGAMYLRLIPDASKRRRRPVPTFVPLDYVSIPAAASNYYTAERQCYWEPVTQDEFDTRIREGMYRDIESIPALTPDESEAEKAAQKVEGKKIDPLNSDGLRQVCEISVYQNLEPKYGIAPYLISIDFPSSKVVSITRNWEENDKNYDRMQWMVEWIFFQWRGAQGIGLGQAIGSLAGAATGALRALLDSAHIQNIPTLARLKGANFSGQNQTVNATQVIEIKGGVAGDADIRKLLMPIPFAGPSQTLFELLGFLTDAGRQAIHVALDKLSEDNKNLPVGTTLALIEEGMKVMSAIHLRLFHSMTYFIRILHRLDRMYLNEEELKDDMGEVLAHRADFEGPMDCIPTADPEIFSDVQRIAQAQIIADRAAALPPGIYDVRETELFLLERAKIPNPERFLIPKPEPEEMNQVNENVAMALGRPVTAFPQQDHLAHITVLVQAITSPLFGQLPIIAPSFLPAALGHLKEHLVLWYANEFYMLTRAHLEMDEAGMGLVMKERDPETRKQLDQVLAAASNGVLQREQQVFGVLPQVIQQAQQLIAQYTPQTLPSDPDKRAEVERKTKADQQKDAREREKLGITKESNILNFKDKAESRQAQAQLEFAKLSASERTVAIQEAQENARAAQQLVARLQEIATQERAEDERAAAELNSEERRNTQDNLTALRVAAAEIQSSEKVKVSSGTGANKNPSGGRPKG